MTDPHGLLDRFVVSEQLASYTALNIYHHDRSSSSLWKSSIRHHCWVLLSNMSMSLIIEVTILKKKDSTKGERNTACN